MARQHGTGSLFQRGDGRWIGRYRDGYTRAGEYRYRTVSAGTEKDARAKLNAAIRKAREEQSDASTDTRATVAKWCEEWLTIRVATVRPKTYSTDRSAVTQWITPTLGTRRLADLTPADLRKLDAAQKAKGRSLATIRRTRDVLILALKAAVVEGYTVPHRLLLVDKPTIGTNDRTAIPVAQSVALLKAAEDSPDRSRWVAALLQGMRQGECLGLTWDRLDLEHGLVDVSWQAQELVSVHGCGDTCGRKPHRCPSRGFRVPDGFEARRIYGRWHWTRPKTKAGSRMIPLVPWMVGALTAWREVAPESPYGLVWPAQGGGVRDPHADRYQFEVLQETAEVAHPAGRPYTVHEARHATATILMALGVDTQVIIAIMGHSSILSTRTYQHADLDLMRTALAGVAERLQLTT